MPAAADASRRAVVCDRLAHHYGNAADRVIHTAVYPTDLIDAQWAVLYVDDNGVKWRALPIDFPESMRNLIRQARTSWV